MFDFDRVVERRGTHASKWDNMARLSGITSPDAIPMWVADMDFPAPPGVTAALTAEIERATHGYYADTGSWAAALTDWMKRRYGMQIDPGTKLRKGSVVSLVLGDGVGKREFAVPDITGMSYCSAKEMLEEYGIIMGAVVTNSDVSDTCNAFIFKQNPERFDEDKHIQHIRSGQTMDVWLQMDKPARDSLRKEGEEGRVYCPTLF